MRSLVIKKVKAARQTRNLVQKELAHLIGEPIHKISLLENGKTKFIDAILLLKIADALEVPLSYFFLDSFSMINDSPDPVLMRLFYENAKLYKFYLDLSEDEL